MLQLRGHVLPLHVPLVFDHAVEWLKEREITFLIIDTYARAYGGDENNNAAVSRFLDTLDMLKEDAGVVDLVLTAHTGRKEHIQGEEHARGATRIDDWADALGTGQKFGWPLLQRRRAATSTHLMYGCRWTTPPAE